MGTCSVAWLIVAWYCVIYFTQTGNYCLWLRCELGLQTRRKLCFASDQEGKKCPYPSLMLCLIQVSVNMLEKMDIMSYGLYSGLVKVFHY